MAFVTRRFVHPSRLLGSTVIGISILLVCLLMPAAHSVAATIVLDPGHGGSENGAVSGNDFTEKQFTLSLARRIAERLGSRHRVELTRTADISMAPADRAAVANHLNADLMVSIHAAVAPYCAERSAAIYTHDDARLALPSKRPLQNALDQVDSSQPSWERLQMKHRQRSLQTAGWIKQVMEESDAFDSVSMYSAPLAPLMGADLPAVLLEVGCIHPAAPPEPGEIERQLDAYSESIAKAIDMAVEESVR